MDVNTATREGRNYTGNTVHTVNHIQILGARVFRKSANILCLEGEFFFFYNIYMKSFTECTALLKMRWMQNRVDIERD